MPDATSQARLDEDERTPHDDVNGHVNGYALAIAGYEAFLRDLPSLLAVKGNYRKFVAYHGNERLAIASKMKGLLAHCTGIPENELMIDCIAPKPEWLVPSKELPPASQNPADD